MTRDSKVDDFFGRLPGCFGVAVRSVLAEARTKPGVYPATAGHPRPRVVYSGSTCNQTNGLRVIIYHSRRVPETGNSEGKESTCSHSRQVTVRELRMLLGINHEGKLMNTSVPVGIFHLARW